MTSTCNYEHNLAKKKAAGVDPAALKIVAPHTGQSSQLSLDDNLDLHFAYCPGFSTEVGDSCD
jgi:hypothetical protein